MAPPSRQALLLLVSSCLHACMGLTDLWLIGFQPMTGGRRAGPSMVVAMELMLEEINRRPDLLPGYRLRVAWQDDRCSAAHTHRLFLVNLFKKQYEIFAPGVPINLWDYDKDGLVEWEDTSRFQEVWNESRLDPPPLGIVGAGCSSATRQLVKLAYYSKIPIISGSSTFGGLADRKVFPNFFRTIITDSTLAYAWLAFAKMLGQTEVVCVTHTAEAWDQAAAQLAEAARSLGVVLRGDPDPSAPGFTGFRVSDTDDTVRDVVRKLEKVQRRVVVLLLYQQHCRRVMCRSEQVGFNTAVWMTFGWFNNGWWRTAGSSGCRDAQIASQAVGLITASMNQFRIDRTILSCSANMTAEDFRVEWFRRLGRTGADYLSYDPLPIGFSPVEDASASSDSVCMFAQMLHALLFDLAVPPSRIASRTEEVYAQMIDRLSHSDFEALQGRMQFRPGMVEPEADLKIQQLQDDQLAMIATFRHNNFTFVGISDLIFKLPGERAWAGPQGASSISLRLADYRLCAGEQVLNFTENSCQACHSHSQVVGGTCTCDAGYLPTSDGRTCRPCSPGRFSGTPGATACTDCLPGQFSKGGATSCEFCPRGRFGNESGLSQCLSCPENQDTEEGGQDLPSACSCSLGAYFARPNGTGPCLKCPAGATTRLRSSRQVRDCICPAHSFMPPDFSRCVKCPNRSTTLGDGQTSERFCLCELGTFMNGSRGCASCPETNVCFQGSSFANRVFLTRPETGNPEERFPSLKARYWASAEEPTSVFRCRTDRRCPGPDLDPDSPTYRRGGRPGSACAARLTGIACDHCEAGYHWDGQACAKCGSAAATALVLLVLPILLSPLVIGLCYKFMGDPLERWGSWQNSAAAILFIVLNHYQTVGNLADVHMTLPSILETLLALYQSANDFTVVLRMECLNLGSLLGSMIAKACVPVVLALCCLATYGASMPLARIAKRPELAMERDRLFNVFGSLMFTFSGGVAGMALLLFKCAGNPNGRPTLAADLGVVCYSDGAWLQGLGIGIGCVLLYIGVLGGFMVRAIRNAPERFFHTDFQMRWKFLFIKFHSSAYWWGVVILARNFCINLVPVLVTEEMSQLYLVMTLMAVYLFAVLWMVPYRSIVANCVEIFAAVCIVFLTALLTWHANRGTFLGRSVYDTQMTLAIATMAVSFLPISMLPLGILYLVNQGRLQDHPSKNEEEELLHRFALFKHSLGALALLDDNVVLEMLSRMDEHERFLLLKSSFLIRTDMMGITSRWRISSFVLKKRLSRVTLR